MVCQNRKECTKLSCCPQGMSGDFWPKALLDKTLGSESGNPGSPQKKNMSKERCVGLSPIHYMPIPQQEYQHGSLERLRTRSSIKKGLGPLITQLGPGGPELQFAQIPLGICCWKVNRFFSEDVPIHHKTIMIFLSFQTASCLHKNLGNNMSPCWSWTPGRQKY